MLRGRKHIQLVRRERWRAANRHTASETDFPEPEYIFPDEKVIIELKTLETEVQNTDQFRKKMDVVHRKLHTKYNETPLSLDPKVSAEYLKAFIELFRAPLARVVKKANGQIKSTKQNLDYADYQGILLLINDSLKELPPRLMLTTLARILNGSCSSIRAMIYLTNHYVVIPGDEYGRVLWVPLYADAEGDGLVDFVNRLGAQWFDYCENFGQPSDNRQAVPTSRWKGAGLRGRVSLSASVNQTEVSGWTCNGFAPVT